MCIFKHSLEFRIQFIIISLSLRASQQNHEILYQILKLLYKHLGNWNQILHKVLPTQKLANVDQNVGVSYAFVFLYTTFVNSCPRNLRHKINIYFSSVCFLRIHILRRHIGSPSQFSLLFYKFCKASFWPFKNFSFLYALRSYTYTQTTKRYSLWHFMCMKRKFKQNKPYTAVQRMTM